MFQLISKCLCLLVTSLLLLGVSHAAYYHVEVIVFKHNKPFVAQETWESHAPLPNTTSGIRLYNETYDDQIGAYTKLTKNRLHHTYSANRIRKSDNYELLFHTAWYQANVSRRAKPIVLSNEISEDADDVLLNEDGTLISSPNTNQFKGTFKLSNKPYPVVALDLAFYLNHDEIKSLGLDLNSNLEDLSREKIAFKLKQQQKITLDKIHYFDHPLFGVLVYVNELGA